VGYFGEDQRILTVILPKGVRFLLDQAFKTFLISFSLFSKFIGTISCKLVENMTTKPLNVAGFQLRPNSGINFTCEFLRDPIQTATILSISIIRPDTEAKCCKVCTHEQNDSFLPSRKKKKLYHLQIVTVFLHQGFLYHKCSCSDVSLRTKFQHK